MGVDVLPDDYVVIWISDCDVNFSVNDGQANIELWNRAEGIISKSFFFDYNFLFQNTFDTQRYSIIGPGDNELSCCSFWTFKGYQIVTVLENGVIFIGYQNITFSFISFDSKGRSTFFQ